MRGSIGGLKADSLAQNFLLDSGRKMAYLVKGTQKTQVQYFIDVKSGTVTFLEVTPDKLVKVTTIDVGRNSAHSVGMTQYYGFCRVK